MDINKLPLTLNFIRTAYPHLLDGFIERVVAGDHPSNAFLHMLGEDRARKAKRVLVTTEHPRATLGA